MKLIYVIFSFISLLVLSCSATKSPIVNTSVKTIANNKYNAELDSLLILSADDSNQSYIAANLVDDSANLNWWVYGLQSKDSIQFYNYFDFVKEIVKQCDNVDSSVSILKKSMIEQDFQWQCTSIDSVSFCAFYSRHALSLVSSNRKLQFFLSKNLVTEDYEAIQTSAMDEIIDAWQKMTYGFSTYYELYRRKDQKHTDSCMYLIRSENKGKYAYAVILCLDNNYLFSLEDMFGQYTESSSHFYTKEAFSKFMAIILSSSISNLQKIRCINSILQIYQFVEVY